MSKLISFGIPSYNSQDYMEHCIETLLTGKDKVEIIIVDDGSKDKTGEIADRYAAKYPDIVRVIHQENGGHGSGVMAALRQATGLYYKVVDSDDWVNEEALQALLKQIEKHQKENIVVDLYITNYVYEHVADQTQHRMGYHGIIPENRVIGWEDVRKFPTSTVLLMHSLLYRREALLESGIELPKHTFYVDNVYAYQPLPKMKTLFYMDIDFYRYFIGRADQSVNMENFFKRYDQQIRVMKMMLGAYSYDELKKMSKGLRRYMFHDLSILMLTTMLFINGGTSEKEKRKEHYHELWVWLKKNDRKLYRKIRYRSYVSSCYWMFWGLRRKVLVSGYRIAQKKLKLG